MESIDKLIDWEQARHKLIKGEPLYGESESDIAHIEYALGLAVDTLRHLQTGDVAISTFIEVGKDDRGYFVSFILNEPIAEEIQQ
jgi:hypothetical protein